MGSPHQTSVVRIAALCGAHDRSLRCARLGSVVRIALGAAQNGAIEVRRPPPVDRQEKFLVNYAAFLKE